VERLRAEGKFAEVSKSLGPGFVEAIPGEEATD
jgi:hypothetical protein